MPDGDGSTWIDLLGIVSVFVLVAANGFFVAAEFSLVAVRRSRVVELVAAGRANAPALQKAVDHLDAHLAATQLGITISSLALGWVGEPALAHLIEPLLVALPGGIAYASSHVLAVVIAFTIITALHIVLGELAPKSLALQRSEGTALWVVRPLGVFLFLLRPAIVTLNGLGNLVLRLCGLRPGSGEGALHSADEIKLLVAASQEGGLRAIRESQHEHLLIGRGGVDEPLGMILKKDLLDQVLAGGDLDPLAVIRPPVTVHESMPIFRLLEQFRQAPLPLAVVVDEYGDVEGIVTQTDLLEAIAGDLPDVEGEEPDLVEREDGSLLIDGMMAAYDAFNRLGFRMRPEDGFHTVAGFALSRIGHLPVAGESFSHEGWRFEIVDMDGMRIDKLLATREPPPEA